MSTQAASPEAPTRAKPPVPRRRGGSHKLSAGDKGVLVVMVAIPTLIQLILIWIPMVLSIALVVHQVERARPVRHQTGRIEQLRLRPEQLPAVLAGRPAFWPLLFIQSGSRLPITTGIKNLQGQFLSDYNLIAAGATFTIIPTLIIYILLQRHFVAGLTLGASKG